MSKIEDSFETILEVSQPLRLEVQTGSGEIRVMGGEDGRLKISSAFQVRARTEEDARKVAEQIKRDPPIEVAGDLVQVGDPSRYGFRCWPFGPSVVLDFLITAPAETALRLDSGSGDQEARGLKGGIRADAGSGDVTVEECESNVDISTCSGDISVARVRGRVSADAGSGHIDLATITGQVEINVGSGDVRLTEVEGAIEVEAGSGDIVLESSIGDAVEWSLETGSGDVRLLLPPDSQFRLCAKTSSGELETDFPLTISGKLERNVDSKVGESPTATIKIKTSSGDISLKADGMRVEEDS